MRWKKLASTTSRLSRALASRYLRYEAPEGTPVDFTGSTARMQARPKFGSPTVLIELTDDDGIELGDDGTIVLTRSADITAALKFSSGVYDLEITPPVGEPYKLLRGNVFLKREVTI